MSGWLGKWFPWLIAVALVVVLLGLWRRGNVRIAEAERATEKARLDARGFAVAFQRAQNDLEAAGKTLDALQGEIDRLKSEAPGTKVVTVIKWKTAYLPAGGTPRPGPEPGQPCPACLLAPGDQGQIRVQAVRLQTGAGNLVAVGAAEAVRVEPEPETVLFGGRFEVPTDYAEAAVKPECRWSVGGGAWWKNPGWTAEIRGGFRVFSEAWLEAAARFDNQYLVGVRWELP